MGQIDMSFTKLDLNDFTKQFKSFEGRNVIIGYLKRNLPDFLTTDEQVEVICRKVAEIFLDSTGFLSGWQESIDANFLNKKRVIAVILGCSSKGYFYFALWRELVSGKISDEPPFVECRLEFDKAEVIKPDNEDNFGCDFTADSQAE